MTRPIGLCALAMIADGFNTQVISYAAPMIAKEWALTPAALGPMFSSALAGLMARYVLLSPLFDRFGHRWPIIIGTFFLNLFTLLTIFAHGLNELIVLRFLAGIGLGGVGPSAICGYSPRRLRATFVLIIYCGFSLGFIIAGYSVAELMADFGWRSLFYAGGLASMALALLLAALLPESLEYLISQRPDSARVLSILHRIDCLAPAGLPRPYSTPPARQCWLQPSQFTSSR